MKFSAVQLLVGAKRLLALAMVASLAACAVAVVAPEIRFETRSPVSESPESAAVIGMFYRLSEGPLVYNLGVTIISIDDAVVPAWRGFVVPTGNRKIVVKFAGTQSTKNVTFVLNARPNHKYLIRAAGNLITEKSLGFWIEDAMTGAVVTGQRPVSVLTVDASPQGKIAYDQFRTALDAAATAKQ
jgi:hypothetical protein